MEKPMPGSTDPQQTARPISFSAEQDAEEESPVNFGHIKIEEEERWENVPKQLRATASNAIPRHHEMRETGTAAQLLLLLCKSMKMVWRYKILSCLELLVPIVGVIIVANYTVTLELDNDPRPIVYSPFGYDEVSLKSCKIIQIAGNGGYVDDIITALQLDTKDIYHVEYNYIRDIDFDARLNDGTLCAVVNFVNLPPRGAPLPRNITYELRLPAITKYAGTDPVTNKPRKIPVVSQWETNRVNPSGAKVGPRNRLDNTGGSPGYYSEGFLFLQHKIDCILLRLIYDNIPNFHGRVPQHICHDTHVQAHFQRFPYPPHQHVNLSPIVSKTIPLVFVMSYLILFASNTWLLVQEKEVGMKDMLDYFNVSPWKQWLAWIAYKMCLHAIALILIAYILTSRWTQQRAVINKTSTSVIYLFMLTYVLNCICTSCLFSTFFYKARNAVVVAVAVWIFCYLPTAYLDADIAPNKPRPNDKQFSIPAAVLYCFMTNFGLSYGFQLITNADINSNGVTMDSLLTERFDLGHVIVCLNAMSLFSVLLAIYIERVWPTSKFLVDSLSPKYFVSLDWWKGHQHKPKVKLVSTDAPRVSMEETHPRFFESNPMASDPQAEIALINATRHLEGGVGIFQINIRSLSGEVLSILGPQKSGKTALCHAIAGLLPITEGIISLKKRNMKEYMGYAKSNVGICPQVDALYDYLSVEEHISLFVQLKGVIMAADAYEEIENIISELDLEDIRKVQAKKLTRGQKRMVHVGIAFAGGSKVVLLDEPTDGMDVPMQRTTWRFIDSERYIRSIFLFTKSGEEASYLGDRVVVLINGEAYARGTPSFIKTTFDFGYHLELKSTGGLDKREILMLTQKVMPRAKLLINIERELKLLLPEEYTPFFPSYFESLEERKAALGIHEINISYVPFDDILKRMTTIVVKEREDEDKKKLLNSNWKRVSLFKKLIMKPAKDVQLEGNRERGIIHSFHQFHLLAVANVKFTVRRWKWNLFAVVMMTILIFFGPIILETLGFSKLGPLPGNEIRFKSHESPRALLRCHDKYKRHEEFCVSVRQALGATGVVIDEATSYPMDRQLLGHYERSVEAQDVPYDIAVDVQFKNFENDVVLYFDNQPLHVLPIGSTFFTKLLYLRMRKASYPPMPPDVPEYEIHVINNPLPYKITDLLRISRSLVGPSMVVGSAIVWGCIFYLPSNLAFQFQKEKQFKIYLKSFGMNIRVFWLAKLFWDMLVFSSLAALVGPVYFAWGYAGFDNWRSCIALYMVLLCWGLCGVSIVYALSFVKFIVKSVRNTFFYIWMLSIAIGPIPWTLLVILTDELYDEQESTRPWLKRINGFLILLPGYALAIATHRISIVSQYGSLCAKLENVYATCNRAGPHPCCDVGEGRWRYFTFGRFGILGIMLLLLAESASFFTLIFTIETPSFRALMIRFANFRLRRRLSRNRVRPTNKDGRGDDEFARRFEGKDAKSVGFEILINNLTKRTDKGAMVDGLTMGIREYQCIGFIGTEASGQSTVLRILSGFSYPTSGDITIEDKSLVNNYGKYVSEVNCCPKEDMLFEELTGREMLMLVGTVEGIKTKRLKELIHSLSLRLGLSQFLDKLALHYDLGPRRKLSFALALLGHPRVLVLDEPFHEIDPESQAQMMKLLAEKKGRTTLIISSASMEITEAFCDRIVLLLDGKMALVGSPTMLMANYTKGIAIIILLVPEDASFYEKKGIEYQYDGPDDYDSSPGGSLQGSSERIAGSGAKTKQGQGRALPAIVISGAENAAEGSQKRPSEGKKFLALPGSRPSGTESSGSSGSGGSSGSSHASSSFEDPLWLQELDPIMEYMEDSFPSALLFEKSPCYLHYHLQDGDINLSDIFRKMEIARIGFELETYRVGTGTLSQLLGSYTRAQSGKNAEYEQDK